MNRDDAIPRAEIDLLIVLRCLTWTVRIPGAVAPPALQLEFLQNDSAIQ